MRPISRIAARFRAREWWQARQTPLGQLGLQEKWGIDMQQTGLGVALKVLRDRRTLSLRELGQLSTVDHAYVHRLETGDKTNPTPELVSKLVKVLKPSERDAEIVRWLVEHPDTDPELVRYVLEQADIDTDIFMAAAGVRHRGNARPDPATLIARIRRAFEDDDE